MNTVTNDGGSSPYVYMSWRLKSLAGLQYTNVHVLRKYTKRSVRVWVGPKAVSIEWAWEK